MMKPCPFCQSDDLSIEKSDSSGGDDENCTGGIVPFLCWVECAKCGACGPTAASEHEAVARFCGRYISTDMSGPNELERPATPDEIRASFDAFDARSSKGFTLDEQRAIEARLNEHGWAKIYTVNHQAEYSAEQEKPVDIAAAYDECMRNIADTADKIRFDSITKQRKSAGIDGEAPIIGDIIWDVTIMDKPQEKPIDIMAETRRMLG